MRVRLSVPAFVLLVACGTTPEKPNGSGGTGGSAGSTSSVGGTAAGGTESSAGTGGSATTGGSSAGGTAGSAAGGTTGGGTDTAGTGGSVASPAAELDGVRYEVPCGTYQENDQVCDTFPEGESSCPGDGIDDFNETVTFGGAAGILFEVGIRVRGVVEPKPYMGGTSDGMHFYTGGTPVADVYNVYSLEISDPPQIYYFNHDEGMGTGHYVFTIDHQKFIQVAGGATISMLAHDSNCSAIRNCTDGTIGPGCVPNIIPDVPPDDGFDGQFVQIDIESVGVLE